MKILKVNIDRNNNGSIDLVAENQDDIYELTKIIQNKDSLKCFTHRKVSLDSKKENQTKIKTILKISIENITTDLENGIIYCKGKTCEENEYVKLGSYHTLDIELGTKFTLFKSYFNRSDIKALKECTYTKQEMIFVVLYDKECVISMVGRNRINILNKYEVKKNKLSNIVDYIQKFKDKVEVIVITSFSDICNDLYSTMIGNSKKNRSNSKMNSDNSKLCLIKLPVEHKNSKNTKIINHILTSPETSCKFKNIKYVDDIREIDNFFVEFEKGNPKICIGKSDIEEGVEYQALEKIFITDEMYRPNDIEQRKQIDNFCTKIEKIKIRLYVVPVSHYLGEKLRDMGGICGLLRFIYN